MNVDNLLHTRTGLEFVATSACVARRNLSRFGDGHIASECLSLLVRAPARISAATSKWLGKCLSGLLHRWQTTSCSGCDKVERCTAMCLIDREWTRGVLRHPACPFRHVHIWG